MKLDNGKYHLKNYELEKLIGKGGHSVVFRAVDLRKETEAALKIFLPSMEEDESCLLEYFVHEAECLRRLNYPGIIGFNELSYHAVMEGPMILTVPFISLEYFEGETIADTVDNGGAANISQDEKNRIFFETAKSLEYSHEKGVLHLDVKLDNIFYDGKNTKLFDWSFSNLVGDENPKNPDGIIFGTAGFISPEISVGEEPDFYSDVYSLGVTAYCLFLNKTCPLAHRWGSDYIMYLTSHGQMPDQLDFLQIKDNRVRSLVSAMVEPEKNNRPTIKEIISDLRGKI